MSEPVEPALTPEQWKPWKDAQWIQLAPGIIGLGPHAVAALALYRQPFGFSPEDVEALSDAIYTLHGPKMDALRGLEVVLDSIRERIEALLPPE